jgi:CRISPR type III-B/RAMP module RAMP protein Cmr1
MAADETLRPPDLSVFSVGHDDRLLAKHHFQVITPIFGGSAAAGKSLLERPIREMEVRGMLRLWWRCLKAPAFPNSAAMFAEETKLFGSTETPSPFDVLVRLDSRPADFPVKVGPMDPIHYGIYPFCQTKERGVRPGLEFTVELRGRQAEPDQEVIQALRTWSLLGGYGCRSRRGCGSLMLREHPATLDEVRGYVQKGVARDTTVLSGALALLGPSFDDAMKAWSAALAAYRDFRKGEDPDGTYARDMKQAAKRLLNPSSGDRMTSPVITKPLPVGGSFRSMLLVMNSPHSRRYGDDVEVLRDVLKERWRQELKAVILP